MAVKILKLQARKINTTPGTVIYFPDISFIMNLSLVCKYVSSRAMFMNQWDLTFGWVGLRFKKCELRVSKMCSISKTRYLKVEYVYCNRYIVYNKNRFTKIQTLMTTTVYGLLYRLLVRAPVFFPP